MASKDKNNKGEDDFKRNMERAKQIKEDFETQQGWTQQYHVLNEYNSWSKTFKGENVPVRILFQFENLPISIEKFAEMMHTKNMETRMKWDNAFADLEILQTFPDGSMICSTRIKVSFPLTDRDMVLLVAPPVEIDWYGKKAYAIFVENSAHASRPAGANGLVRATNGGNFYVAVADDKEPDSKCEVLGLSNNNYNGWLPNESEWFVAPKASKVFYQLRQSIIEGNKQYFS